MATEPLTGEELRGMEERFVEEVWNEGNLDHIDEMTAETYVGHWFDPSGEDVDREGLREFVSAVRTGFPDFEMHVEEVMVGDGTATVVFTTTGTHEGEFMGITPTGESVRNHGIFVHRYEDGQHVEAWAVWDTLSMLQQLGVAPESFRLTELLETAATLARQGVHRPRREPESA